jgi:Spy/CpxP family protein refolding chaperone
MWIGWLFGTLCLVGLVRAFGWRRRGFYHHPGWAYRYGSPGYGYGHGHGFDHGFGHGFGRGFGRGFGDGDGPWGHGFRRRGRGVLFSVLERLDATPAQEKAIMGAIDDLRDTAADLRSTLRGARQDLAAAIRAPSFDASAVAQSTAFDQIADRFTAAVATTLARIHEVLDERQRKMLGELIESGFAHAL